MFIEFTLDCGEGEDKHGMNRSQKVPDGRCRSTARNVRRINVSAAPIART
jgi:hypothetical protein